MPSAVAIWRLLSPEATSESTSRSRSVSAPNGPALRLAISQRIAERAGQPLSLLVFDEIFGSLDEDRRIAVMELLRNLADRFPQVILITHIDSVRESFDRVIRLSFDAETRVASATLESRDAAA